MLAGSISRMSLINAQNAMHHISLNISAKHPGINTANSQTAPQGLPRCLSDAVAAC